MFRRLVPAIGVASVVALIVSSGGPTRGQTNIDQGKPASELFANYCVVCHKSTRGLANGRNSLSLSLFLREHYAASSQQAAALAAYVISAGGNAPAAKPERARSEEPKGQEAKGQEAKGQGAQGVQEPRGQEAKGHETKPRAASVSPRSEPEKPRDSQPGRDEAMPAPQEPGAATAAPVANTPPSGGEAPEVGSTTNAGVSADSNDSAPVPRDNIPD